MRYNLESSLLGSGNQDLSENVSSRLIRLAELTYEYYSEYSFYKLLKGKNKFPKLKREMQELKNSIIWYLNNELYLDEKNESVIKAITKVGEHFTESLDKNQKPFLYDQTEKLIALNTKGIELTKEYLENLLNNNEKKIQIFYNFTPNSFFDEDELANLHLVRLMSHFYHQRANLEKKVWDDSKKINLDYSIWDKWYTDNKISAERTEELYVLQKDRIKECGYTLLNHDEPLEPTKDLEYAMHCYFSMLDAYTEKYKISKQNKDLEECFRLEKICLNMSEELLSNSKNIRNTCAFAYYRSALLIIEQRKRETNKQNKKKLNDLALERLKFSLDSISHQETPWSLKHKKEIEEVYNCCGLFGKKNKDNSKIYTPFSKNYEKMKQKPKHGRRKHY